MLVLPLGPALLAMWKHDSDAHLLLLTSLTPQHWFYDSFILWLIPKTRQEILATSLMSWGAASWGTFRSPGGFRGFGIAAMCLSTSNEPHYNVLFQCIGNSDRSIMAEESFGIDENRVMYHLTR